MRFLGRLSVVLGILGVWVLIYGAGNCEAVEGYMTYYTEESCKKEGTSGVWTASGERFNEDALTCAMRGRDFGREYVIYSPDTGKDVVVRQNDFGPGGGPASKGVIIDTTPAVWRVLGLDTSRGKVKVYVQPVEA